MTLFIVIFSLLQCSRTEPTISLRYACTQNYKTLMKEIKEDTIKCNDSCVHGPEDITLKWQYSM